MSQQEDVSLLTQARYERVGFLQGFIWKRTSSIDFPRFSQYWYGPP
jgi:hypothetical protein